mgnify:CR=1 FL=1
MTMEIGDMVAVKDEGDGKLLRMDEEDNKYEVYVNGWISTYRMNKDGELVTPFDLGVAARAEVVVKFPDVANHDRLVHDITAALIEARSFGD